MTVPPNADCLACEWAVPSRTADGRINFAIKMCVRMPPTPVVIVSAPGTVSGQTMFPTVGKGIYCGEFSPREDVTEAKGQN